LQQQTCNLLTCLLAYLLTIFMIGCGREEAWEPGIVARVGDRKLTTSEVIAWEASLRQAEVPQELRSVFVRHWVEEELLYQAALEQGLMTDAWMAQRLDEITRSLLVSRLLETEYRKITPPAPSAVKAYFQKNSSEFVWPCLHLDVEYWKSDERIGMEGLRSNIQRGRRAGIWMGKAGSLENGHIELNGEGSTDPDVWRVVKCLVSGQVSQVLLVNDNYWVFKLIDRREPGEPQGYDDARDEIVLRLTEKTRRNVRDELVRKLVDEYHREGKLFWSARPRPERTAAAAVESKDTED